MNMGGLIGLVATVTPFVFVLAIIYMGHRHAERKRELDLERNKTDDRDYDDLADIAQRMERRIEALEQLLDAEQPDWRANREH